MKNIISIFAAALVAVLFVGNAQAAEEYTVQVRAIEDRKAVFATVESVDDVRARARIGGTISGLSIDEGSQVAAGQKIAVITDKKLPLKLAALEAKLKSMYAQRKLADTDLERAISLRQTGAGTQAKLDETRARLDVVKSEIAVLGAEMAVVSQQIAEGQVLAPVSGRVLSVSTTNGSVVLPGETVAIIARESFILRLRLPERHARFLRVGDTVQVGVRGMGKNDEMLSDAVVQQVYPQMEDGRVIADVQVPGLGDYFVGERTSVHVATGARDVIVAPRTYIYKRYGISFARLKSGGEVALRLGLAIDGAAGSEIEILSGLKAGDVLVLP